jgi:hypothetical protein
VREKPSHIQADNTRIEKIFKKNLSQLPLQGTFSHEGHQQPNQLAGFDQVFGMFPW